MNVKNKDNPHLFSNHPLNPEQQIAVNTDGGLWAVHAGPGSGKTHVLIQRHKRLVESGVDPASILCLTFNANAAEEMRKRAGEPEIENAVAGFRTFHSFCLAFAKEERANFTPPLNVEPLLANPSQFLTIAVKERKVNYKKLREQIDVWKREGTPPSEAMRLTQDKGEKFNLACAYSHYEQQCRIAGVRDFAGLMTDTVHLLRSKPLIRAGYQYRYIMVDESQDADHIQWELVSLLSEVHRNVFAVGDAGQCIYQWRSAHPELFQNFQESFPGAQTLYLGKNHRSTKQIVEFCKVIGPVRELAERFYTDNPDGTAPVIGRVSGELEEANQIADAIKASGFPPEHFAVLARTNRQLVPVQMALADNEVPYKLLGDDDYWKQQEVKGALAYAQLCVYPTDRAVLDALQSPFDLTRFLRKQDIKDYLAGHKERMFEALTEFDGDERQGNIISAFVGFVRATGRAVRGLSGGAAMHTILERLRAFEHYMDDDLAVLDNRPIENLAELKTIASRHRSLSDFLDYVRRITKAGKKRKGVALGTVHSAKGREWPEVYVIGATEGVLPHKNGELDEESRIFFVACSRAEHKLRISYYDQPSRFLAPFLHEQKKVS